MTQQCGKYSFIIRPRMNESQISFFTLNLLAIACMVEKVLNFQLLIINKLKHFNSN